MGLLDSDAEELKRNSTGEGSSGRRVNQSGLGALKGLSKYSNLTAKYRTTGKTDTTQSDPKPSESVEHSRGTTDKSVQSQGEVRAEVGAATQPLIDDKVSANTVQSPCKVALTSSILRDDITTSSDEQSPCEVGAKSVQSAVNLLASMAPQAQKLAATEVGAKSVQFEEDKIQTFVESKLPPTESNEQQVSAKSVHNSNDGAAIPVLIDSDGIEVSAKSGQSRVQIRAHSPESPPVNTLESSLESIREVSAKSGQSPGKVRAQEFELKVRTSNSEVSAKSVQSPGADQVTRLNGRKNEVRAKSVQEHVKVSAKSVQIDGSSDVGRESSDSFEVSAKSVQSPGEVRAISVELQDVPRAIQTQRSKVHMKSSDSLIPTESVISISGSQRVIVDFLFQLCLWNNSLITPPITKQQLTAETGLLEETALSSIKRLRNKNIIDRYAYKDGKAGWTQYQFSEMSYKELLHLRQVGAKSVQPSMFDLVKPFSPGPVQTVEVKKSVGGQNWFKSLDFSKVHPIGPMVVNSAIRTLVQENLEADVVQDFINRFTSWTSTQGRITSPIGLFCDKLKELAKEGDSPIFACMTDEEREIEAAYATQVEKVKVEMELIRKARSESQVLQESSQFEEWYAVASDEEKAAFAETSPLAPAGSEAYKRILKVVYLEKIRS